MNTTHRVLSSYKDPSGFVFIKDKEIYREVSQAYKNDYDKLIESGLYNSLVKQKLLVAHKEVSSSNTKSAYKILKPDLIPFVSYPYEWSFSQLKDAATVTLRIQKEALKYDMSLKDATPYNIQFLSSRPIFIDTLSFEMYKSGKPWVAYKQFCEMFLSPLSLMIYKDIRLNNLLRIYPEGIPLDLTEKLLSFRSKLKSSVFLHLFLHSRSQKKYSHATNGQIMKNFNKQSFIRLIDSLYEGIEALEWKKDKTVWGDYYDFDHPSYSDKSLSEKSRFLENSLKKTNPGLVWDLGANTGKFSRIASDMSIPTVSIDFDPVAVELNYQQIKKKNETSILPLCIDLMNPSPSLGWANQERDSLFARPHPDMVFALAVIHHLCIANNIPIAMIAHTLSKLTKYVVIEFVPKEDPQTQVLLSSREDIFPNYTQSIFEQDFETYFSIIDKVVLSNTTRCMYLLKKKNSKR